MEKKQQGKWYKCFVQLATGIMLTSQLAAGSAMVFAEEKTIEAEEVPTSELSSVKDLPVSPKAVTEEVEKKVSTKESVPVEAQATIETQPTQSSENILKVEAQTDEEPLEEWMPDENLRKAVAKELKITESEITKELVGGLTSLSFSSYSLFIEEGTVVNLEGLEYVDELLGLDTTYIVPTNIPNLKVKSGAFITVRPDVLVHLDTEDRVRQLNIGSYNDKAGDDRLVTSEELTNPEVIATINKLNPTEYLRIYSKDMTDFSLLKLNVDTKNGQFYNFNHTVANPIELPPLKIVEGSEEFVYSQGEDQGDVPTLLKGISGQPLISGAELRATRPFIQFLDENKTAIGLSFNTRWTEKGFIFSEFPEATAFIRANFNIGTRAFTNSYSYSIVADIPIQRVTPAADVTVKYLDEDNEEVQLSKKISGNINDPYDATTSEYKFDTIDDYVLDETQLPSNATGTLSATAQEVIYHYKKKKAADVTVNYLDENDQSIRTPQKIRGALNTPYDATTAEYKLTKINDYILDESRLPTNGVGTIDELAKTVNYYYKKTATPTNNTITIKYIDKNSKEEIRQEQKISRESGDSYDATTSQYKIQQINKYVLDEENLPTNAKGTCNGEDITVTYQYKTSATTPDPETGRVTVKYLNDAEEEIYEAKSLSGEVGTSYDATIAAYKLTKIDDYNLNQAKIPNNATGTFTATNQVVKYYYKKDTSTLETSQVIVKYVDENGKEIREEQVLSGKIGEAYDVTTDKYKLATIDDYQLNEAKLPGNMQGNFIAQDQEVTYVYQKNTKTPTPTTNYLTPTGRNYTYITPNSPKNLPNTGENRFFANILVVIGGLIVILTAVIVFKKKRIN